MKTGHRTGTDRPRRDGHERTEAGTSYHEPRGAESSQKLEEKRHCSPQLVLCWTSFILQLCRTRRECVSIVCMPFGLWQYYHQCKKLTSCVRPSQAYKRLSFIRFPSGRCLFMFHILADVRDVKKKSDVIPAFIALVLWGKEILSKNAHET